MSEESLTDEDLREIWPVLSADERLAGFHSLSRAEVHDFFLGLSASDQAQVLREMPSAERRPWIRLLEPDDAADVCQKASPAEREELIALLDEHARREVNALLAYAEDAAGGLMSPRFVRLRPDMTVDAAIRYLRRQAQAQRRVETLYYAYVLDGEQRVRGVVSFRDLFASPGDRLLSEVMHEQVITVPEDMDQEAVAEVIARHDLNAVPVVDSEGRMKGIVTVDDIVDVVRQEATEDIQKLGGMEALDTPYLQTGILAMIRKRAGWLSALFLGEMLTASAMSYYEEEIARAVVLALFVPLIISSGGNSGSQATTLIIRAMALGEVGLRDWWRIVRRELSAGLALGAILASIGLVRILVWQALFHTYGAHSARIAAAVSLSLVGVVTWGTISGSMLPFIIRRLGFDPASASAPFVATLVDVSGLVIYFNVAQVVLRGTLL
ncbi:Mg/Co/Ni transporter MgtE / CBS domain protein [Labilithrix luteola]|uniref:Magnesium transporter MgtE n=1 Tax=Labilithrix luteola TaxID=1391654 RepID=A0A0K1PZ51_9BACT|nr:magnesium transporter [Labilithrix luteola]AKU98762.1 Mg/Co/Ni transporter MgtE / CBS domain protein [Labilithrix luteola]